MKNNHEVEVLSTKVKNIKINTLTRLVLVGSLTLSLQAEFLRDTTKEIVLDTKTNLVWQDSNIVVSAEYSWTEAITYCENLSFASFDDWRLPNINELESIIDDTRYNPSVKQEFVNTPSGYGWSSSTDASNTSRAWNVYLNLGSTGYYDKSNAGHVRCVRSGQ